MPQPGVVPVWERDTVRLNKVVPRKDYKSWHQKEYEGQEPNKRKQNPCPADHEVDKPTRILAHESGVVTKQRQRLVECSVSSEVGSGCIDMIAIHF